MLLPWLRNEAQRRVAVSTEPETQEFPEFSSASEILTPQSVIMTALGAGHHLSLSELKDALSSHQLGVGYPALISIVNEMCDRGLIVRDWHSDGYQIFLIANKKAA